MMRDRRGRLIYFSLVDPNNGWEPLYTVPEYTLRWSSHYDSIFPRKFIRITKRRSTLLRQAVDKRLMFWSRTFWINNTVTLS